MDLQGRGVVVTGAGDGIGKALATALAAAGARVVVTDVNAATVGATAAATGAHPVPGDLTDPHFAAELVEAAREHLGVIDVFFSNAGITTGGEFGSDVPDDRWATVMDLNVMSHVRLARALVPHWKQAGAGHLVVTASAAGLLTMIGDAPYSVSKHAAVAFAEWLAIEHGDDGITVQAICPQGVDTAMLRGSGAVQEMLSHDAAISPDALARLVVESLGNGQFLILPHPEVGGYYATRATSTDGWLAGMRKLRRRVLGAAGTGSAAE